MHTLGEFESAAVRYSREIRKALEDHITAVHEAAEAELAYEWAYDKSLLQASGAVKEREAKARLAAATERERLKNATVRVIATRMRWQTYRGDQDVLRSLMSNARAEAEFVRMGG